MIYFQMCCLYVILVLPGSVDTQLGWSGKFSYLVEYLFLFSIKKVGVIIKNNVTRFYGSNVLGL